MNTLQKIQGKVGVAADGIWGPKTRAAVAAALGCKADDREIQRRVGVKVDGIIGSKSVAGIAAALGVEAAASATTGVRVMLDIGHTADRAREWPAYFNPSLWSSADGRAILDALGLAPDSHDSLEHAMNAAVGRAVERHLRAAGVSVSVLDRPEMGNDAEISWVVQSVNAARPSVFVSIHHNAACGKDWATMGNKASGHVCYHVSGSSKGRALAREIHEELAEYRRGHGVPGNRAESVQAGTYAVIRKVDSRVASCLVEVGFYDNLTDARFVAGHVDGLGAAIAEGIRVSL